MFVTGIGQDSHRFTTEKSDKVCMLAGIPFSDAPAFAANSDGDVILHAICNAISTVTGKPILGKVADTLCLKEGITDSRVYLAKALEDLSDFTIEHVALSIEGKRPKILPRHDAIRKNLAKLLHIEEHQVGLMATTGEGLTDFGKGLGVQCICILSLKKHVFNTHLSDSVRSLQDF